MARLVVMYGTPKDAGAFDRDYFESHVPIAKKIPGLRKYEISRGAIATPAGPAKFQSDRHASLRRLEGHPERVREPRRTGGRDLKREVCSEQQSFSRARRQNT
jgi:hypothetical protein